MNRPRRASPALTLVFMIAVSCCAAGVCSEATSITGWVSPALGETFLPPGVRVTLLDLDSVFSKQIRLSGSPRFQFLDVPAGGRYRILVEAEGRNTTTVDLGGGVGQVVSAQLGSRNLEGRPTRPGKVDISDLWRESPSGQLVRKAADDIAKERFESALRRADKAVAMSPGLSEAHATRALALLKMGRVEPAEESLLEAVRLAPENAAALRMLGWLHLGTQRPLEAVEPLSRSVALEPGNNQAQVWLAEAFYRLGRYDDAVGPLETVLASDPGFSRASYQLGYAYLRLNRQRDALAVFRQFLDVKSEIDPAAVRRIVARLESWLPDSEPAGDPSPARDPAHRSPPLR